MKFNKINNTKWESDIEVYSAAMLNSNGDPIGIKEPKFVIKKGEYKNKSVYRLYEQHLGKKEFIGRFKTLEDTITFANEEV